VLAHCSDVDCANAASKVTVNTGDGGDDVGQFSSVGMNDFPIIAFYNATQGQVEVADCGDAACNAANTTTVDTGVSGYLSMALDNEQSPVLAYLASSGNLRVAHCDSGTECTAPTLGDPQTGLLGDPVDTSVAVDQATDWPVVSYIDDSGPDLFMRVIHCSDAACVDSDQSTPDPVLGGMPANTSIVLDGNGIPTISRFDGNISQLTVTHCVDPLCIPHTRVLEPQAP